MESVDLHRLPRVRLAHLPTPLEEAPRLSAYLGGPRIWIKRDDLTGLALGGSKARKLEFLLGQAQAEGCDVVVTVGAVQSNHARMTAAAARRLGMDAVLVLQGDPPARVQGNLLLDRIFGAEVRLIQTDDEYVLAGVTDDVARQLRRQGRRPYVIPRGGSTALGAVGYLTAWREAADQIASLGIRVDAVVHASTSGGTQSGLYAGIQATGSEVQVVGISAGPPADVVVRRVRSIVTELGDLLGRPWRAHPDDLIVDDRFVGQGYGLPTPECLDAIRLVARTEGVLLDPVYTGKAMAGLMGLIGQGRFTRDQTVIFWHTGGQPALFAHADLLAEG
ncbi:MAG: D-cysteine desulfhydrase family protein [Armatimonadota bacterium]|nr:D-cysteine desulfhydrase family protein [Armatimonadota bacterium]MDR7437614.1 D-cysteine desulfhydrase family protein [Armatimonadota bacterium]MDR7472622.1 D-cysteine desulfhydrase family protein [Armatimonadota bacterium]MDR7507477.1 D-cysteine desulfhydrase family protein [Armatimonadota bacterium]MDR7510092.1 D-cysteine desulfhydrase family protein [Armatimonadota bacterium]